MAGAGYKLFNTGDVLTAAQVNTYLMEQTVMVFADAAARTTALTGVVSEGMLSYLKSTKQVEVYNGSAWVASDDPNAIQNTIVDAKGDLITATAADTPARLAVGSNGETLVADSAATTGLRWQGNFSAGKNKIINGDFGINQRSFSSTTSTATYTFDRWITTASGGTSTYTAQTFTPGAAPVAGYEAKNYIDIASTGQSAAGDNTRYIYRFEGARTFAGETITVSFWAKAASGTPSIAADFAQVFGTGGSPSTSVLFGPTKWTLSTSWTRYSVTVSVPSISGKTLGTNNDDYLTVNFWTSAGSNFNSRTNTLGIQTATISLWGVQAEAGNVATAFQTATGTLQGELAACQRYYWRQTAISGSYARFNAAGLNQNSTTNTTQMVTVPVNFRAAASSVEYANIAVYDGATVTALSSLTLDNHTANTITLQANVASGLTAFRPYCLIANNNTGAYIGISAEL